MLMPAFVAFLSSSLLLILLTATVLILRRLISGRQVPVLLCIFPILPVGQLLMLHSFSFDKWSVSWLLGLLLGLAAIIMVLLSAIMQEKKAAVEEELRDTRHRMELEKSHYEAVAERRAELAEICQDFNEKLENIAVLAHTGEDAKARASIAALAEKIDRTKENPYCAFPVINAVLTQKEKDCRAAEIVFDVDLKLPSTLVVTPMHLCSIFSNILDNAIAACRSRDSMDKPVIRLSSALDGDYLLIKSANPADAPNPSPAPAPGHGYGLRIIAGLVEQYGGDFHVDYSDGVFTVLLLLPAADH
jgi:signal transduction histidine kinase